MLLNNPHKEQYLRKIREDVQTAARGIRQRDFHATPGPGVCPFFAFNDICPAAEKN